MMTVTATKQVIENATTYRGVVLDKMIEVGPKGGKKIYYRSAFSRDWQVSPWSHTREQAARSAPGYTG